MAQYRTDLPQLGGDLFLADGGIETTLIFHEGLELPHFASFHLLQDAAGTEALRRYFRTYASIASGFGVGVVLESATWRASTDWCSKLGYTRKDFVRTNRQAVQLLEEIRTSSGSASTPVVISGCIGPRGDGYAPTSTMSEKEAEAYHSAQVEVFADTAADMVCASTMNYIEEAVGVARASQHSGMPVAISFTVETDGRLPSGETLRSAIERVDAATSSYVRYYMINCAHPSHFHHVLREDEAWTGRISGLRANASCKSHAELNESPEIDIGDPVALASDYAQLKTRLPNINVMGGCCGTDHRHIEQIAQACLPLFRRAQAA